MFISQNPLRNFLEMGISISKIKQLKQRAIVDLPSMDDSFIPDQKISFKEDPVVLKRELDQSLPKPAVNDQVVKHISTLEILEESPKSKETEKSSLIEDIGKPVYNLHKRLEMNCPEIEFQMIETEEINAMRRSDASMQEALRLENQIKNRYMSVVPYDKTRVKLRISNNVNEPSDYINANFVQGEGIRFIATQGPLPFTFKDFWRMIWEERVPIILMLTRTVENERIKCHRYWPESDEESAKSFFGDIRIEFVSTENHKDNNIIIRKYRLLHMQERDSLPLNVVQIQYLGWPDHGVPNKLDSVLDLISTVENLREEMNAKDYPIVIHCSAGIGRTGAFCAIHTQLTRFRKHLAENPKKPFAFDLYNTVLELRRQRAGMVQQAEQYRFCYEVLLYETLRLGISSSEDNSVEKPEKNLVSKNVSEDSSINENQETMEKDDSSIKLEPTRHSRRSKKRSKKKNPSHNKSLNISSNG